MKIPVFPLLLLATMLHMNLPGTVIYVNHAATGACDGSSWIDAFTCLQPAIDAAVEGDEIWVAEGTYYPTSDHGLNLGTGGRHFRMKTGVGIYGGFNGQETERDERDWSVQATVLSGDLGLPDDKNDNAWHVFFHPDDYNVDYTAILDGFTITMGMAAYHMDNECGGGMYLRAGSPGITNCLFTKNEAREGGGVYAIHSQAVFTNCRFSENDAGDGGGIYLLESQVEITNSVFEKHSGGGWGGGLYVKDSSLNLLHCSIINNSTMSSGPGIEISGSEGVITHSIFRKNSSAYSGGAVCSSNSSLKISDTVIMENRGASNAGMGFYSSTGSILNCLITNNSSEGIGSASGLMSGNIGGLDLSRSSPEILNCVITGNSAAKSVGGIKMYESSPKIVNCIINGNIASEGAGGISVSSRSFPVIANTIVTNNSSGVYVNSTSNPVFRHNCVYGNTQYNFSGFESPTGTDGNISVNPLYENPAAKNFALKPGSPCIDAGENAWVSVHYDLAGTARIIGGTVDMGAYESMHATCQEMKIIDCILGKIPFSSDMDYNSDGILDVSDHLNMWQGLGGGIP